MGPEFNEFFYLHCDRNSDAQMLEVACQQPRGHPGRVQLASLICSRSSICIEGPIHPVRGWPTALCATGTSFEYLLIADRFESAPTYLLRVPEESRDFSGADVEIVLSAPRSDLTVKAQALSILPVNLDLANLATAEGCVGCSSLYLRNSPPGTANFKIGVLMESVSDRAYLRGYIYKMNC